MTKQRPIVAVGGVVLKGEEVLLIQRGRPPLYKHWSIPGGKVELGEPHLDALKREILEETSVTCEPLGLIGVFESLPAKEGDPHYVMVDYACRWIEGEPVPGDDAMDAEFLPVPEALSRVAWDETRRAVQGALKFVRDAE